MSRIQGSIHDEIKKRGATVEYLCAEDVPPRFQNRWSRFSFPYLVRKRAVEGRFDIVNVHEPAGALVALLKGNFKVVVTSHGVEQRGWEIAVDEAKRGGEGPSLRSRIVYPLTSLWQSRIAFQRADHVFCLNEEDREFLRSRFKVVPERITRIFPAAGPEFLAPFQRDYSRFRRVLFAGTWLQRKGIADAVAAFCALADRYPQLEFATLGAGVPADIVCAAFPESLRSRVQYFSPAGDRDVSRVMAESDVFLLPSIFEGTPLTLMEAMHSGLPIVTTDACGMRDVIRSGENGLLVPVRDPVRIVEAVDRFAADPSLRQRLGCAARTEARWRYTWEESAKPVWQAYQNL